MKSVTTLISRLAVIHQSHITGGNHRSVQQFRPKPGGKEPSIVTLINPDALANGFVLTGLLERLPGVHWTEGKKIFITLRQQEP